MEKEKLYLFSIISSVLKGSAVVYLMDDLDYSVLFGTAKKQDLTNFLCEGLKGIFLPEKIAAAQKKEVTMQKLAWRDYSRLLTALGEKSMDCMPVGGAALRGLYSDPTRRESRDFDILIRVSDREEARAVAEKNGFAHVRECRYADYYFKPPATRITLRTDYLRLDLWAKAVKQEGSAVYALRPEDRYVCALYALKKAVDENRGQAKLLVDLFVLNFACEYLFNREYINKETDKLGIGFFETKVNDLYMALFLENKDVRYDEELLEALFVNFPKKLPPRYISPEKEKLIKKVKRVLLVVGIAFTAITIMALIILFDGSFGAGPEPDGSGNASEISGTASGSESSQQDYISLNNGLYYGEISGGVPEGEGRMEYYSGDIYEGSFTNGERNGYGVFYLAAGGRYEGEFVNGSMSGSGTFYYANGDIVSGNFEDGLPNGECKFMYANGSVYEGNLVNGVRQGEGTFTYENGDKYEGNFADGDKSGNGTYTWASGAVYSGKWVSNAETEGKYTDSLGTYEGSFKDEKFTGEGKYTYANGDVYTGNFVNGLESDDSAVLTYKLGGKYEGAFVNGVFHGKGIMYLSNGDKVKGTFVNGKLDGEAQYYYAKQDIWQTVVYEDGIITEYKSVIK